jgi:hypothetical protein
MEIWTNDELLNRWNKLLKEYREKSDLCAPILQRLSNIEKELFAIKEEVVRRDANGRIDVAQFVGENAGEENR